MFNKYLFEHHKCLVLSSRRKRQVILNPIPEDCFCDNHSNVTTLAPLGYKEIRDQAKDQSVISVGVNSLLTLQ